MFFSISSSSFLKNFCVYSRFMFCGYHLLCIKLLIDKIFLFSTGSISPSFVCKGSIFSCLPHLCFYCLKLPLFMLWAYYQIEVAMVVFIEFSPLNACFNFLTTYSEKRVAMFRFCLLLYSKFCVLLPFLFKWKSSFQHFL